MTIKFSPGPCGCCCGFCNGAPPDRIKLEINGITTVAGSPIPTRQCVNCSGLNGIYFLDGIDCHYQYNLDPHIACVNFLGGVLDFWQSLSFIYQPTPSGTFEYVVTLVGSIKFISWSKLFVTKPGCDFGSEIDIPFASQGGTDGGSGCEGNSPLFGASTCKASAIYL